MNLKNPVNFLLNKLQSPPDIAIILGSGLGDFVNIIKNKIELKFSDISGYPLPTVRGHEGKLIIGTVSGKSIYEGVSIDEVTFQVQLFHKLRVKKLIITNSAGCLQKNWNIGDFMNISSLLDFSFSQSVKPLNIDINPFFKIMYLISI